jgi:hypothetical protein
MKRSINRFKKTDVRFMHRNWVEKPHLSKQLKKDRRSAHAVFIIRVTKFTIKDKFIILRP